MPKCFKCSKDITAAVVSNKEEDIWEMPCNAVHFRGGNNFGSSLYDSMINGIAVEIIICDNCLLTTKELLREVKNHEH